MWCPVCGNSTNTSDEHGATSLLPPNIDMRSNMDDDNIDLSINSVFSIIYLLLAIITVLPSAIKWIPLLTYVRQAEVRKVKRS
jgi:hypothetical protein